MDLSEQLGQDFAPGWRPQEGDKIIGQVIDLAQGWSDESESYYPIVTVHNEETDEDVAIHCFHFVLQKKMKELKPKVGERIGIIYKGKVPTKDGKRTVAVYNVKIDGRTVDIWSDPIPEPVQNVQETLDTPEDDGDLPF
jgi:hypothetical protein